MSGVEAVQEPAGVAGNNESGSGSLRAPHPQERANMTAVEGKSDGVGLLVVEWQLGDKKTKQVLGNLIMRLLKPTLSKVASRFTASARGSLDVEDLEQVAALEAFKLFSRYDHTKAASCPFEQHVYRRALRACEEQVRTKAHVVNLSDWSSRRRVVRGNRASKPIREIANIKSRDGHHRSREGGSSDDRLYEEQDSVESSPLTPEQLLTDAQTLQALRQALAYLPEERRELVREVFGIGRHEETSLRSISARTNVPRSRLAIELDESLTELRAELED